MVCCTDDEKTPVSGGPAKFSRIADLTFKSCLGKFMLVLKFFIDSDLSQGFSTWGTWVPGGTQKVPGGTWKVPGFVNYSTGVYTLWYWGTKIMKIIAWRYAKNYKTMQGVLRWKRLRNPCLSPFNTPRCFTSISYLFQLKYL